MTLLLLSALALGAPPDGFSETKEVAGCQLSLGPQESDGVVPMRADCHWPEKTVAGFDAIFADWEKHDELFSTVVSSRVQRSQGSRALVHQVHRSKGISDRELLQWMERKELPDGGFRYEWTRADGETLTPASGNVAAGRSDGFWEVHPAEGGGVTVIHQLSYDPGGSVPGFLVRWFQTSGLAGIVTEAREGVK